GYLKTLFSDEITEKLIFNRIVTEQEAREHSEYFYRFISANGFLYVPDPPIDAGAQVFLYGQVKAVCTRTVDTADRVVFTAALEIDDTARESWNITGDVTFDYVLEKQNGSWVFTSFKLPYYAAKSLSSPATGDSAVFLFSAAALSLGGVLLAAKKRKRAN
ncbi:MAG: LPXTG cell wall anchor domain-containing protein, partial [Clostridia bacterium]|nr:LPXTG cell wall anchor domain-containing protein [Clostridia bacterium]